MKSIFQRLCYLIPSVFLLAGAPLAGAAPSKPADEVIKAATTEFQALIGANHESYRKDLESFYKVVDEKVVPNFDTKQIAQLALGRNWKTATPEQRTRFEQAFKNSLIRTYARAMLDYHDSIKAEWAPVHAAANAENVTVNAKLLRKDAPPIALAFSVHAVEDQWKIYDIAVENISLITNFRSQLNNEIKANGLEAVIKKFEANSFFKKPGEG
ncbi:MAG: MlaC/ttg2D family ABC transporter substrate-binding protein [Panacagrimonas sp.]